MHFCIYFYILCSSTFCLVHPQNGGLSILSLVQLGSQILESITSLSKSNFSHLPNVSINLITSREVLSQFSYLSQLIHSLESNIGDVMTALRKLETQVTDRWRWELTVDLLEQYLRNLDSLYDQFEEYETHRDMIEMKTMKDFAEHLIAHGPHSVRHILWSIHELTQPRSSSRAGLFEQLFKLYQIGHQCHTSQTAQQLLFILYKRVALADAKGYALLQFAYALLRIDGESKYAKESELAKKRYEHFATRKFLLMKSFFSQTPNDLWLCDPVLHKENKTYIPLTNMLQAYIINEADISEDNSCALTCSDYHLSYEHRCWENPKQKFCAMQKQCKGRIIDCQFYASDFTVCMSSKTSSRRYNSLRYYDGTIFGSNNNSCKNHIEIRSWWRWFVHCSYCLCFCEEKDTPEGHSFSLHESVSNIESNYVVTGIRFQNVNGVIHLVVQEGRALAENEVDENTLKWANSKFFKIQDKSMKEDVDYAVLDWQNRGVDLDDLQAPDGHVITGVKLRKLGGHLGLSIRVTPIDFYTGQLSVNLSNWITSLQTPAQSFSPRKEYVIEDANIPTLASISSNILAYNNSYVRFSASSIKKDAGQTVVPFLDIQPLVMKPSSWIGGIGLYYKGLSSFGGFIGLRFRSFNLIDYLKVPDTKYSHLQSVEYRIIDLA